MAEADGVLQLKLDVYVPLRCGGPPVPARICVEGFWQRTVAPLVHSNQSSACFPAATSHVPATCACRLLQGLQEWKRSASAALVFQVLHSIDEAVPQPFKPDAERLPREHVQPDCTAADRFRSDGPSPLRHCLHCSIHCPDLVGQLFARW